MAISEIQEPQEFQEEEEEDYSENGGTDPDYDSDDSEDKDPSFNILEETHAKLSKLSIEKKKVKSRIGKDLDLDSEGDPDEVMVVPELGEKDEKSFEKVQKLIEAGQVEKLKVDQCKVYLRTNGLRLTGKKDTLIQRIKEHLEIINGGGEKKYPVSSFILNCKGDACTDDVVMFEQNVYEMFNIASRSASGPPCGTRFVAGRIVKESYGAAKQQHTFTIEVLWSKGEKPLPPLYPLLIKGRNLYRLKTLRQRWEDEGKRQKVIMEKHSRGSLARSDREVRIQEKEMRKMLKADRALKKEEPNRNHTRSNSASTVNNTQRMCGGRRPNGFSERSSGNTVRMCTGTNEVHHQRADDASYKRPNFCANDHQSPISKYPKTNGLSDTTQTHHRQPLTSMSHYPVVNPPHHRQPLASMNHYYPVGNPPHIQSSKQRQLCRYYEQGRCYFGDNCKFLHQLREECGQTREEIWHCGQKNLHRWPY